MISRILSPLLKWDGWTKVAAIATALTAVAALWFSAQSLQSTRDQYGLSAQGQVTERFTNAVESLGSEKVNVRLGGIYSLERLAKDSAEDQPTIIEILSGFIRTQAPADTPACTLPELVRDDSAPRGWRYAGPLPQTAIDVQAALTVLGRRNVNHDAGALPDLSGTCLAEAHLTGSFAGRFRRSQDAGSSLRRDRLEVRDIRANRTRDSDLLGSRSAVGRLLLCARDRRRVQQQRPQGREHARREPHLRRLEQSQPDARRPDRSRPQ
ncbi:hypothetical protein NCAST_19_01145 [Nocardia asteroides NBRC 15531]|uniref:Uncharacterized protein n=1 Tax=Nocardia asteroides NBRC 15531 TaxID=1110697 RepID=U5EAA9_NOCAS|nr:hypothetical protein NCAST_19_01145 [Nocardia asteroides NBRC 15531]